MPFFLFGGLYFPVSNLPDCPPVPHPWRRRHHRIRAGRRRHRGHRHLPRRRQGGQLVSGGVRGVHAVLRAVLVAPARRQLLLIDSTSR